MSTPRQSKGQRLIGSFSVLFVFSVILSGSKESYGSIIALSATPIPESDDSDTTNDCNFDEGLCLWTPLKNDALVWTLSSGPSSSLLGGPTADHTSGKGKLVYTVASNGATRATAVLVGPAIELPLVGTCVSFWYHMYGSEIGALNMYVNRSTKGEPMWTRHGNQGSDWISESVHIPNQNGDGDIFNIIFEAGMRGSYKGYIALDDISFKDGQCSETTEFCTFESSDTCGYTFTYWKRNSWNTGDRTIDIETDHTYGTKAGYFMMTKYGSYKYSKRELISGYKSPTMGKCLQFYHQAKGYSSWILKIYLRVKNKDDALIWNQQTINEPSWLVSQVTVSSDDPFQIVFEAVPRAYIITGIGLDDIRLLPYACNPPGSCDFERDRCLFENLQQNDVDWERVEASDFSGIVVDHTFHSRQGHFLYISSQSNKSLKKGRIISEGLRERRESCLNFYYQLKGGGHRMPQMQLAVNLDRTFDGTRKLIHLWTAALETEDWQHKKITVLELSVYRIVFHAVVAGGGMVFVDDVLLEDGACPETSISTFSCGSGITINETEVCDFYKQCPNGEDESNCGTCDFEVGVCGFVDISKSSSHWKRGTSNEALAAGTKVGNDHTTNTEDGHVMFVPNIKHQIRKQAILTSPLMQSTFETCVFEFYYKIGGATLSVDIEMATRKTKAWKSITENKYHWIHAQVNIGREGSPFRIEIIADELEASSDHLIAVDDAKFINCGLPEPSQICFPSQFTCDNKVCIDPLYKCDLSDDCGDNSDESDKSCSLTHQCTFQDGTCDWTQSDADDFDWTRRSGDTFAKSTAPRKDHTTNTDLGFYLYFKSSGGYGSDDKNAKIVSPVLKPAAKTNNCYLTFYVYQFDQNSFTLNVISETEENGYSSLLFTTQTFMQNRWKKVIIPLTSDKMFRVIIEGVVAGYSRSSMAIDDVSLSAGCSYEKTALPTPDYTISTPTGGTKQKCKYNQLSCANGHCVGDASHSKRCDFKTDCRDGSDEKNCGPCTFQTGPDLCGWEDASTGHFKWYLTDSSTIGKVGPPTDSDSNSSNGQYMFVKTDFGITSIPAILRSPLLPALSAQCVIKFYYYITPAYGKIDVNLVLKGATTRIWSSRDHIQTDQWTEGSIYLGRVAGVVPPGTTLEISFMSYKGASLQSSKIASIDDVTLLRCAKSYDVCRSDQFHCISDDKCIDFFKVCDRNPDCTDLDDEKECDCTNFCENGGLCYKGADGMRQCRCDNGYSGNRCQIKSLKTTSTSVTTMSTRFSTTVVTEGTSPQKDDSWKTPVGVILGIVALVVVMAAVFIYLHKTDKISGRFFSRFRTYIFKAETSTNSAFPYEGGHGKFPGDKTEPFEMDTHK